MNHIEICKLTKRFGTRGAVDGLSLSIPQGELFALLGVNGAGKTTTIRMLCGLSRATAGTASVCGYDITKELANVRNVIALSPQETAVAPALTARENLALLAGAHGMAREETAQRIEELSQDLHLADILERRAGKLSGGWKRRLSIAMALISKPRVLFLDEPTLGLDVLARRELWDVIRAQRGKTTIVLTTHYMEEAEALADRVGVMKDGHLLAVDTPSALCAMTDTTRLEDAFLAIVKGDATI